ncbi:unnamed protein product [Clavelina lepadiformis]|uniref:Uncharacterized protein n=1 Tax=Clavelina lepadiformis TaxID=159417 RepID=A0ABP0FXR1_CLALP
MSDSESDSGDHKSDPDFEIKKVIGGKFYKKIHTFSVNQEMCMLADRRMTSIRQHSDQLRSLAREKIAASPTTIFRRREKVRMKALERCQLEIKSCSAMQLCYDGRVINSLDRYVFVGQLLDDQNKKCERIVGVKTFPKGTSVTGEILFSTIIDEVCGDTLNKVYSVMADTTAVNTGRVSGVNKRLADYFSLTIGHGIHTLECLFHVNEIYLSHVIRFIEGGKKGPRALEDGALLNIIKTIQKPVLNDLIPCDTVTILITKIAALHIKKGKNGRQQFPQ